MLIVIGNVQSNRKPQKFGFDSDSILTVFFEVTWKKYLSNCYFLRCHVIIFGRSRFLMLWRHFESANAAYIVSREVCANIRQNLKKKLLVWSYIDKIEYVCVMKNYTWMKFCKMFFLMWPIFTARSHPRLKSQPPNVQVLSSFPISFRVQLNQSCLASLNDFMFVFVNNCVWFLWSCLLRVFFFAVNKRFLKLFL